MLEGNGQGLAASKQGILLSYTAGAAGDNTIHLDGNSVRGTDKSVTGSSNVVVLDNNLLDTATDLTGTTVTLGSNLIAGKAVVSVSGAAPSSASDDGRPGEVRYDANYCYVCVATDTWKRATLSTW